MQMLFDTSHLRCQLAQRIRFSKNMFIIETKREAEGP